MPKSDSNPQQGSTIEDKLKDIRYKFEKKMGDAWEKYDSSEYENDLEDYGEDYEKAYSWLFNNIQAIITTETTKTLLKLKEDMKMHTVPEGKHLITRSYLNNSIDFMVVALQKEQK